LRWAPRSVTVRSATGTVPFACGCGRCEWCRAGEAQVCPDQQQPGFTHWGSFAEYVALHAADDNLVAIPEQIDFPTAASLRCRFATAYRALVGRARVSEGRRGHIQVGLLPPVGGHPRVPMARVIGWELDVLGSHGMAAVDYPDMMALIEQGTLQPSG
jgi:D-arabinose 1-dehydrogenase-like Zn-dependent alcohol dehydrogenase